jgi:predicted TIM-barrel fold metal-dependent hydrolase
VAKRRWASTGRRRLHIDFHLHLALKELDVFYESSRDSGKELPPTKRTIQVLSVDELIRDLDRASLDVGVFQADGRPDKEVPFEPLLSKALQVLGQYVTRFIFFAGIRLFTFSQDGEEGISRMLSQMEAFKIRGVKVVPSMEERYPNAPFWYPLYEALSFSRHVILFHTGQTFFPGTKLKYNHPLHLDEVAVDFPNLSIVMAHFGFPWFLDALSVARRHPNVYVDISGLSLSALDLMPWRLIESSIPEKVIFGSDYPICRPSEVVNLLDGLPIQSKTKERILGENACRVLGLGKK